MRRLNENGAVAALVAIMLVLIIVCVALVVDLGHIHNVKGQLQKAVDAAALAGARQLNGGSTQIADAQNAAIETAEANGVTEVVFVDADCTTSATDSCLGTWDADDLASNAATRFAYDTSPNAVLVRATRNVDHLFFFFTPSTEVTADAIAVVRPKLPILPLAIITCVPADKMVSSPGALPDTSVCGIADFDFGNDQEDTAAWSSLSFNASANEIIDYMSTEEGKEKFNNVIFGALLNNKGIENMAVDSAASTFDPNYPGCPDTFPYDYNITCGLGQIEDGIYLSPKDAFEPPLDPMPDLIRDPLTGIYSPTSFDPLTGYNDNGTGELPRWYHIDNSDDFTGQDHFTRIWTQDGILLKGEFESWTNYDIRLKSYADCTDTIPSDCNPYGDDRFKILEGKENFILETNNGHGQLRQNLIDTLGFAPDYWPDFRKVIKHAGYPKVGIINGNATTVIQAFVDNEQVSDGTNLNCSENDPFPTGQETLRVNAPVIFAGACEDWQAISNPSPGGYSYIGLSKFLLTRVWTNQLNYDCGSNFVELNGEICSEPFDPGLFNNNSFSLPAQSPSAPNSLKAIEGLSLIPVDDDNDDQGSILDVFLVE